MGIFDKKRLAQAKKLATNVAKAAMMGATVGAGAGYLAYKSVTRKDNLLEDGEPPNDDMFLIDLWDRLLTLNTVEIVNFVYGYDGDRLEPEGLDSEPDEEDDSEPFLH
jgi:hypothetical protein